MNAGWQVLLLLLLLLGMVVMVGGGNASCHVGRACNTGTGYEAEDGIQLLHRLRCKVDANELWQTGAKGLEMSDLMSK